MHVHHGLGNVRIHSSFDIDEVEHLLYALAHSLQEIRQLVAGVFLESVALTSAHLLYLSV